LVVCAPFPANAEPAAVTKIGRFQGPEGILTGIVDGDLITHILDPSCGEKNVLSAPRKVKDYSILVPCEATQVFGVASNYKPPDFDPAKKAEHPGLFFKAPSALVPHGGNIEIPKDLKRPLYEGEMVVVIGKRAKNVAVKDVPEYILGVTCGNDVSGGDWGDDFQMLRVKATDTFAPCGPWIVTGLDYNDLLVELRVNGELRQSNRTSQMIHSVDEIVSFISQYITLEPGDLIYSGTPGPIGELKAGDVVEVEVEGVGVLRNTVIPEP
jgi:2-keto-4-pentenoate hydratase/2-oxohepta-3-ene-1,7-dioic acid hydratase in catechol pathway